MREKAHGGRKEGCGMGKMNPLEKCEKYLYLITAIRHLTDAIIAFGQEVGGSE